MAELRSAYTKEEIIEATRLLLQIRDDCVKINNDSLRKEKYKALNMAIDVMQYKWNTSEDDIIFSDM